MKNNILQISLSILFFIVISITPACNSDNTDEPSVIDFDIAELLQDVGNQVIVPNYQAFASQSSALKNVASDFVNNPDESSLDNLKAQFQNTYTAYQHISMFEFGPATDNGYSLQERLNTFPANIEQIETQITAATTDIDSQFKSTVGLPALEYVIYGTEEQQLALFTTDAQAQNRLNYLAALINDIDNKAQQIYQAWATDGYLATFTNSMGNADGSSLSNLVNQFNYDFETLKNFKFKIPLGKFDGGVIQPHKLEGYYSGTSAQLAYEQAQALLNVFEGGTGTGFDDYLAELNYRPEGEIALETDIEQQLSDIISALRQLPDPLSETLVTDKARVDQIHDQMQLLVPLIKREMTSAFGVKISYQDNDGD